MTINEQIEQKLRDLRMWDNEIRIPIPIGFTIYRPEKTLPDGYYMTLRLSGEYLYQSVNQIKDGKWMIQITDGSVVVMYKDVPGRFYQIIDEIRELDNIKKKEEEENNINNDSQK